jgi:STE24 endopeptidase
MLGDLPPEVSAVPKTLPEVTPGTESRSGDLGHNDRVTSLDQDFTAEQIARSRSRKRETLPLRLVSTGVSVAAVCVLGFSPFGADLVRAAGRIAGGGWVARAALGAVALNLVLTVVALPTSARMETINRRWGLSTRTWRLFWTDTVKGFAIGAVLFAAVSIGLYALIRALPDTWWLAAAGAGIVVSFVLSFLVPVVLEPLFNKFRTMDSGPLRDRLMALSVQSGVTVRDILVSDASRRTTATNAYVSGMGRTRRIVVWDTTIEQATSEEVAAVTAHELGHAARRDVVTGTALSSLGLACGVALLAAALHWTAMVRAAGALTAGRPAYGDPRSLALVVALLSILGAVGSPLFNAYSRRIEARADQYALDLTRDAAALVATWRRLAVLNLADLEPHPLAVLWWGSHPPIPARIAASRAWAAEHGLPVPGALAIAAPES